MSGGLLQLKKILATPLKVYWFAMDSAIGTWEVGTQNMWKVFL